MSRLEIAGVPATKFQAPIIDALRTYERLVEGGPARAGINFPDLEEAAKLKRIPGKPYSARAGAKVHYGKKVVGDLVVVAFAPGEGSGDESSYKADDLDFDEYPAVPQIIPRSKEGVVAETHLTLVSALAGEKDSIYPGFGNLSLMGLMGDRIVKLAELGQEVPSGEMPENPDLRATMTVGRHELLEDGVRSGDRFGDPHAIYNDWSNMVQICAFFAFDQEHRANGIKALKAVGASEPAIDPLYL